MNYTNHVLMILQKAREHVDLINEYRKTVEQKREQLDWYDRFIWLGVFSRPFLEETEERVCRYAIIEWSDEKVSYAFIQDGELCPREVRIDDIVTFLKNPENVKSLYDNENRDNTRT